MTKAEALFWDKVRGKQLSGLRVKRQYGVGPYILDFYIPVKKIAIEIDGGIHQLHEVFTKDKNKDAFLVENGISVIRILNEDIASDLEGVIEDLNELIERINDPICLPLRKGKDPSKKTEQTKK